MTTRVFDSLLDYDRTAVLVSLLCVVVSAWIYLLRSAGGAMGVMGMGGGPMVQMAPAWTPDYAAVAFFMWAIMMVAMMLPSAVPTILLVASLARKHSERVSGMPAARLFTAGCLAVWTGFSVAATLVQWGLDRAGLLSEAMASRSAAVAGLTLLAAGLYQLTPLKQTCLRHCRSPLDCLAHDCRLGVRATVANGMRHGLSCLGGCGLLMGLLFVGGLMNVLWIAGLTLFVLVEHTLSGGSGPSRVTGAALIAWGSVALTIAIF